MGKNIANGKMQKLMKRFCFRSNLPGDNRGVSTVEVILLLIVFVGIVVIFREKITELVTTVFDDLYKQMLEF